jgi:hypothetical protein
MMVRLIALLLPASALVLGLPAQSALAAPPTMLPLQVQVAAPYLSNPNLTDGVGRAFH